MAKIAQVSVCLNRVVSRCGLSSVGCQRTFSTEPAESSEQPEISDKELKRMQDKSRMKPWMRKKMIGETMPNILFDYQTTVRYRRQLYARFGRESGIDPALMWPSADELRKMMEMEKELEPSLAELLQTVEVQKKQDEEAMRDRELKVEQQMAKLNTWMKELQDKKAKKITEILAVRQKKDRLIEEVRQYFGYRLDPKDPKFQEVLETKEKEERKAAKEAKRKEKMAQEMARLAALAQQSAEKMTAPAESVGTDDGNTNK